MDVHELHLLVEFQKNRLNKYYDGQTTFCNTKLSQHAYDFAQDYYTGTLAACGLVTRLITLLENISKIK